MADMIVWERLAAALGKSDEELRVEVRAVAMALAEEFAALESWNTARERASYPEALESVPW